MLLLEFTAREGPRDKVLNGISVIRSDLDLERVALAKSEGVWEKKKIPLSDHIETFFHYFSITRFSGAEPIPGT